MEFLAYSLPLLMLVSALAVKIAAPRVGEGVSRISVGASAIVLALATALFLIQLWAESGRLVGIGQRIIRVGT